MFCRGEGGGEGGTGFGFKQLVPPLKVALFVVNLCLSCFGEIVKIGTVRVYYSRRPAHVFTIGLV